MKGHVALENLNGGLNNQTPASIVSDRHPACLCLWAVALLQSSSPCQDGASGSDMSAAVTLLQRCPPPLHLVTGATWLHTPLPTHSPSLPPSCHDFPAPTVGSAGCRNALSHPEWESVASVRRPFVCVCVCVAWLCGGTGLSVTAWVSGVPLCKDVKVCHWASLWEHSWTLSCKLLLAASWALRRLIKRYISSGPSFDWLKCQFSVTRPHVRHHGGSLD